MHHVRAEALDVLGVLQVHNVVGGKVLLTSYLGHLVVLQAVLVKLTVSHELMVRSAAWHRLLVDQSVGWVALALHRLAQTSSALR